MYISIDIGGTNTRIASSQNLTDIDKFEMFPSQGNLADQTNYIEKTIGKITNDKAITAISVGVAGVLDLKTKIIVKSPNYETLTGLKIERVLGKYGNSQIIFMNDTKMAALGEAVLGSGEAYDRVAFIALGTGVGGALVINKNLDATTTYEPGHQIVNFDDSLQDGFGLNGTIEAYISGTAFKNIYKMYPHECNDTKIWDEYGSRVAILINNVNFMWNPQCIVIGGGMAKHFEKFLPAITNSKMLQLEFVNQPKIFPAQFGQGSGVTGGFVALTKFTRHKK